MLASFLIFNALVLTMAALLDRLLGDPLDWIHPVQVMGWLIARFTSVVTVKKGVADNQRLPCFAPVVMRILGIGLGLGLIVGSGAIAIILMAACLAGKSLRDAAESVLAVLADGDIAGARTQLSYYVGRDTDNLSEAEILRAILETVTENAIDGVTAPLFYGMVGAFLGAFGENFGFGYGGVALAIAYKAASTLDSMVGYRASPYSDLGWFSAKTDDVLTWLPCRLTVLTLALLSGKPLKVWQICDRDAGKDPSPNSGWSECVYAAILQVQLGGTNYYGGIPKEKPLLGDDLEAIAPAKIQQALNLTRLCCLVWLGLFVGFCLVMLTFTGSVFAS